MASLSGGGRFVFGIAGIIAACSPEARRVRDGGPGADPGNKIVIDAPPANPHAADTTLWPGRAPAPVDLLAKGIMPPPPAPQPSGAAPGRNAPSGPEQRAFTGSAQDPRTGPERPRK
jgi:hypothetical protein